MCKNLMVLAIIIACLFSGCGANKSDVSYEWNGGKCECGGEYMLSKISASYYHYTCDKCGNEVMFSSPQSKL